MLQHDNPFRRFTQGLSQLKRIKDACLQLQEEAGANPNLVLFAVWTAQQQLRIHPDWPTNFQQLVNWNRDYTQQLRRQHNELQRLAPRADKDENGPLHQMQQLLQQAEGLAEVQEQAVLYFYYQQRTGLLECENRTAALLENLSLCFAEPSKVEDTNLKILLEIILDEQEAAALVLRLREQLEKRFARQAGVAN